MNRWFVLSTLTAVLCWSLALHALVFGSPLLVTRSRCDLAAGLTLVAHLLVVGWLQWTRRLPDSTIVPAWALVQAAKHRRKGTWFAGWGASAGLCWFLVRPELGPSGLAAGWPVWFVVAANLGLQPGLIGAEVLTVNARGQLGRLLGATSAVDLLAKSGI